MCFNKGDWTISLRFVNCYRFNNEHNWGAWLGSTWSFKPTRAFRGGRGGDFSLRLGVTCVHDPILEPPRFKMFITINWTIHTTIPYMILSCMCMIGWASRMNCLNYVYRIQMIGKNWAWQVVFHGWIHIWTFWTVWAILEWKTLVGCTIHLPFLQISCYHSYI